MTECEAGKESELEEIRQRKSNKKEGKKRRGRRRGVVDGKAGNRRDM